jgi:glycerol-3-phosphate acyltransferase PlsY
VVGIALGHASRHLIRQRGGEGEAIALAALIVGYSMLALEIAVTFWLITFLISLSTA